VVTTGPTSGLPGLSTGDAPSTVRQWQTGQLLQATVTGQSAGKVLLAIGNRQVSAETSLPLEKGQQLTLQVRSPGAQPVLQIISALKGSPLADLVRRLLPRQAPLTPLLASIRQLARLPNPPTPALLTEQLRVTLQQLPDITTVSSPQGLKQAIADSGIFLENRLLQQAAGKTDAPAAPQDFKANLLRLVQLVRNWPAGDARPAVPAGSNAATAGAHPLPTGTGAPLPAAGAAKTTAKPAPSTAGEAPGDTRKVPPAAAADQLRRAARTALPATVTARSPATPVAAATTGPAVGNVAPAPVTPAGDELPAPLRGTVPIPQSALQASLDLVNRLGNFRTDLLQQAEAALARIQLHQLAAVPREGERGLLEWLFELPIRRGDDIDLWSLRLLRDNEQPAQAARRPSPHWTVQLAFDLPGLGPVQAQVQLRDARVSAHFWTEQAGVLPLFRDHLHELHAALSGVGLDVEELNCRHGSMQTGKRGVGQALIREKV